MTVDLPQRQGRQYTALRFTQRLVDAGVAPSTGSTGDSFDNALAENLWSTIKVELLYWPGTTFATRVEAEHALIRYITGGTARAVSKLDWVGSHPTSTKIATIATCTTPPDNPHSGKTGESHLGLGRQRLTCPRQHPFGPVDRPASGRFPAATAWRSGGVGSGSRCLSAARHPLLGHPVPPRACAPLAIGLPIPDGIGPRRGFHVPRMRDTTGVGAPSTPRPAVFTRPASQFRSPLAASTSGQALPPGCSSRRSGLCVTRRHRGFTCVRPSGLPLARLRPGRNGGPWASPSSFAPPAGKDPPGARRGGD